MEYTTEKSIDTIKNEIKKKISSNPSFATNTTVLGVVTDQDHHPYSRFYRNVYYYPEPIVFEREAGWRKIENDCYRVNVPYKREDQPNHCFEIPCSTILPCYPVKDKLTLDTQINNSCIVQYR